MFCQKKSLPLDDGPSPYLRSFELTKPPTSTSLFLPLFYEPPTQTTSLLERTSSSTILFQLVFSLCILLDGRDEPKLPSCSSSLSSTSFPRSPSEPSHRSAASIPSTSSFVRRRRQLLVRWSIRRRRRRAGQPGSHGSSGSFGSARRRRSSVSLLPATSSSPSTAAASAVLVWIPSDSSRIPLSAAAAAASSSLLPPSTQRSRLHDILSFLQRSTTSTPYTLLCLPTAISPIVLVKSLLLQRLRFLLLPTSSSSSSSAQPSSGHVQNLVPAHEKLLPLWM